MAKLAGVPSIVISRAKKFLAQLERNKGDNKGTLPEIAATNDDNTSSKNQLNLEEIKNREIIEKIKSLNIDTTTPLEALNFLYSIKREFLRRRIYGED